jgi:hypothetical protein
MTADAPWVEDVARAIGRLNLASPLSLAGDLVPQLVALTCLATGGFLVLSGWRHHRQVLAGVGMLAGGWLGLVIKGRWVPDGALPALPYLLLCGALGAFLAVFFRRLAGVFLGGCTAVVLGVLFLPPGVRTGDGVVLGLALAFLSGGALGAFFPRFFFIADTGLVGASLCAYALTVLIDLAGATPADPAAAAILLHLGIFLPLLVVGIAWQYATAPPDDGMRLAPSRRPAAKPAARTAGQTGDKPEVDAMLERAGAAR